jgi:hypothetical protein
MALTDLRRERRMRLLAAHAAAVAVHALVRDGRHHAGGLADDAGQRLDAGVAQVGDQLLHAEAADLFLVAEGEVDRERASLFRNARHGHAMAMKLFMSAEPRP